MANQDPDKATQDLPDAEEIEDDLIEQREESSIDLADDEDEEA